MRRRWPIIIALICAVAAVLLFIFARRNCDDVCAEQDMVYAGARWDRGCKQAVACLCRRKE